MKIKELIKKLAKLDQESQAAVIVGFKRGAKKPFSYREYGHAIAHVMVRNDQPFIVIDDDGEVWDAAKVEVV